jgi:alpha-glucosidase
LKLILDFVPNHTSDESIWFKLSELNDPYYKDFYVWSPGKTNNQTGEREPPSNWNSLFRYSMWQWSDIRQEYYLHQCIVKQPDLNYRNPNVVKEMKNVLLFWLDKGVDGFRIDAIPHIFETVNSDGTYPDEPVSGKTNDTTAIDYTTRIYTRDLPETYELVYSWRELMDDYKKKHGGTTKVLMTEAYAPLDKQMLYYGNSTRPGSEVPFNFAMIDNINVNSTPADYKSAIDSWLHNMPQGPLFVPNWVVGNHDNKRVVNRFGMNRGDAINMMVQMLPGVAITYNGEEIVMTDKWLSFNDTVDPQGVNQGPDNYEKLSRDPARTPFQWDDSRQAGFSTSYKTWLPVNDDYKSINVKSERLNPNSHLNVFKRLVLMRKLKRVVQDGDLVTVAINNLLILKREFGIIQLFVILNLGSADQTLKLEDVFSTYKRLFVASVVSDNAGIRRG